VRISEIFHSIQGEGMLVGMPSVFVRVAGCNLRCRWCDTPYASWRPEGEELAAGAVAERVLAVACQHVVLTGGEPMVAPGINELARRLREAGRHVTIETAATVAPGGIACDLASLSPKLADSTPAPEQGGAGWTARHETARRRPDVLRAWLADYDCQLKFVVSEEDQIGEILDLLAETGVAIPPERVLLMPEGSDARSLEGRQAWLSAVCLRHGFRYCDRLHIRLFGNTRGT
jgi:7-carboxy-7-deazaguanine synthase